MERTEESLASRKPIVRSILVALFIILIAPHGLSSDLFLSFLFRFSICAAGTAWLIETAGWPLGIVSLPPVFVIGLLLGGSPLTALASLLYFPCGAAFCLVSRHRFNRMTAAAVSTAILSLSLLVIVSVGVYREVGSLALNDITAHYSDFFTALRELMSSAFVTTVAGQPVSLVSDESFPSYLRILFGLFPGVVCLLSGVLTFFCGWLYRTLLRITHEDLPSAEDWRLSPAPISAIFFLLALIVVLAVENADIPYFVSLDLLFILAPFFFFAGMGTVFEVRIVNGLPRPRLLRPILFFTAMLLAFFRAGGMIYLLILPTGFGVFDSIRSLIPKRKV